MRALIALLAASLVPTGAYAQSIDFGGPIVSANSLPFGASAPIRYQQIYSSSQFSDAVSIYAIQFQNYNFGANFGPTTFSRMTIDFSTTSAQVNALNVALDDNHGSDRAVTFDDSFFIEAGTLPYGQDYNVTIVLDQPFTYHPADGNLLADFSIYDIGGPGFAVFATINSGLSSRAFSHSGSSAADDNSLFTRFLVSPATSPVPEGTVWTTMIIGLGAAGILLRRGPRVKVASVV